MNTVTIPWRRKWQSSPIFLPGKSQVQWGLVEYCSWGWKRVGHDLTIKQQQNNWYILQVNFHNSECCICISSHWYNHFGYIFLCLSVESTPGYLNFSIIIIWGKKIFGGRVGSAQASLVAQTVKNLPAMWETRVQPLGGEDPVENGMATHSGVLARRTPWTEEPSKHGVAESWTQLSD